jgi:hypothetical protein
MGGTDLMDENIHGYKIGISSKIWWTPHFKWWLYVTIQNAFQLKQTTSSAMTQSDLGDRSQQAT